MGTTNQTSNLADSSNMGPQVSSFTLLCDFGNEIVESSSSVGTAALRDLLRRKA